VNETNEPIIGTISAGTITAAAAISGELMTTRADIAPPVPVASAPSAASLLQAISTAASNPTVDIDKMERFFAMYEKTRATEAEIAFNAAMSRAQSKILPVLNNAENTQTRSRYAKLSAINKEIVPAYTSEGLSISFDIGDPPEGAGMRMIAIVSHEAGHTRRYHMDLALDDKGAQGTVNKTKLHAAGSTSSYARRYLICMIFNASTEDDNDGVHDDDDERPLMSDGQLAGFKKRITDATTKEAAVEACKAGIEVCNRLGDLEAYKALRSTLAEQIAFIEKAAGAASE